MRIILIILILTFCNSCIQVRGWEREVLSRKEMLLESDSISNTIDDHIYFSKEASSGGRSFSGGGCGCN